MKIYGKLKKYKNRITYLAVISIISSLVFDNIVMSKVAMLFLVICLCVRYYLKIKMRDLFLQSRINNEPSDEISYEYVYRWAIVIWVVFVVTFMGVIGLYLGNKIGLTQIHQTIARLAIFIATYSTIVACRYSRDSKRSQKITPKNPNASQFKKVGTGPISKLKNIKKGEE